MKTLAIFACLLCAAAQAQQPAVFQSETKEVSINAIVTGKKGDSVGDLTAKDFRIWEDNKAQIIQSFSVSTESAAEPRRMVLFFDDAGMSAPGEAGARQAAAQFIAATAGPARLMAVVSFDGGYHVAQGFTDNAARLRDALRDVRLAGPNAAAGSPRQWNEARSHAGSVAGFNARGLIQSMENLARNLNAMPGRKIIIVFTSSDSFSSLQPDDVSPLAQACNRSDVAVYPVVETVVEDSSDIAAGPVGQVRPGVPGPNSPPGPGQDIQPSANIPFTIAKETGGLVVPLSNDLPVELQKVAAGQSQYYVLSYTPPDSKEGVCHALRLKVDRKHIDVHARSSYCTGKPQDLLAESRIEQDLEKRATAQTARDAANAAFGLQAPFFYAGSGVAQVHVAMDIPAGALKFERQKGKLRAELNLLGIATTSDGHVAARFSDTVERSFDREQDVDRFKEKPLHYEKDFKIVPGRYNLAVVFSSGENSGKIETPLAIDPYQAGQFALSGLTLSRQVRPAAEIGLESALVDQVTPLIAAGMQVIPAGSRVFGQGEHAYCYFEIYEPRSSPAMVGLRVLDAKTGAVKWNGGSAKVEPPAGKSTIPVGLSFPTGSLAPGSYQFEITAMDPSDNTIKRAVDFEIGN
ncbi:MAG TPA: VWA domain-containing protein [Bryobacteraceae bacterium]|nr:VWA domain-containing protein [Bryobacteraceae bacterium]